MKDLFEGREELPSYRMFSTKWGENGHIGLKRIENEYNRSWYSCIKERWMKKKAETRNVLLSRKHHWQKRGI